MTRATDAKIHETITSFTDEWDDAEPAIGGGLHSEPSASRELLSDGVMIRFKRSDNIYRDGSAFTVV